MTAMAMASRLFRGTRWPRRAAEAEAGPEEWPEVVILFAGMAPGARRALEILPGEARSWRVLAEMEAERSQVRARDGQVWEAGICAGRAEAYRTAAELMEGVLIEALDLWDEYERQVGQGD